MVWIIALLCMGLTGLAGYRRGAICAVFSLLGVLAGLLLAGPLSPLASRLLPALGFQNPLWQFFIPAAIAFLAILGIFKIAGIKNTLLKQRDQFAKSLLDPRFFPGPVQIGVGLEEMKMIVHGLLLVHVLVAEPRIGIGRRPITAAHFQITAVFRVVRMTLDQFKEFPGAGQGGGCAKGL